MIVRIVKMTFKPEKVNLFLDVFNQSKEKIRNFKGCQHLSLLQETNNGNIFFTYSFWNSSEDLDHYRNSDLFKETWSKTKVLFDAKPEAWSVNQVVTLT